MFHKKPNVNFSLLLLLSLIFSYSCTEISNKQRPNFGINGNSSIKIVHHDFEWSSNNQDETFTKLEGDSLAYILDTVGKIVIFKDLNENPDIYRKWYINGQDINESKAQFSKKFSDYGVYEIRLEYEFQKTNKLVYIRKKLTDNKIVLNTSEEITSYSSPTNDKLDEITPHTEIYPDEQDLNPILTENNRKQDFYKKGEASKPSPIENYLKKGKRYMAEQQYKNALIEFEKVLAINPNQREAIRNKTECKKRLPSKTDNSICALYPSICKLTSSMIKVRKGIYSRGSRKGAQDERPVKKINISQFHIGQYEVTQQQWIEVMGSNPSIHICLQCPVENISSEQIKDFLFKLSQITQLNYRLPTEAEWEYAAIGGVKAQKTDYSDIDKNSKKSWTKINSGGKTHPVGTSDSPNRLGIYDMSGNVSEWCLDWYDENFYKSVLGSSENPINNTSASKYRVVRGGNYDSDKDEARLKNRSSQNKNSKSPQIGFRLVRQF